MLIHDIIKLRYVRSGYLPNYPYHLISDKEMCNAFLNYPEDSDDNWEEFKSSSDISYFKDNYPLLDESLEAVYRELVVNISYHLNQLRNTKDDLFKLPDWVYSYMLGSVVGVNSPKSDIHDMLVSMDIDNIDDDFLPEASHHCYTISKMWLARIPKSEIDHRSPSIFGELHVLKYLRLLDVGRS